MREGDPGAARSGRGISRTGCPVLRYQVPREGEQPSPQGEHEMTKGSNMRDHLWALIFTAMLVGSILAGTITINRAAQRLEGYHQIGWAHCINYHGHRPCYRAV